MDFIDYFRNIIVFLYPVFCVEFVDNNEYVKKKLKTLSMVA